MYQNYTRTEFSPFFLSFSVFWRLALFQSPKDIVSGNGFDLLSENDIFQIINGFFIILLTTSENANNHSEVTSETGRKTSNLFNCRSKVFCAMCLLI